MTASTSNMQLWSVIGDLSTLPVQSLSVSAISVYYIVLIHALSCDRFH